MGFKAITFGQNDCGKKIETQRFYWTFSIDGQQHRLQLVSSFLSGKKKILLDSIEIYSEKKLLNINFEFRHSIEDHSIRITQDKLEFECYIDNQSFQSLMHRNPYQDKEQKKMKIFEEVKSDDPFSQFSNCFQKVQKSQNNSEAFNNFGDFDMNFSNVNVQSKTPSVIQRQPKQVSQPVVNGKQTQTDFFGFSIKDPEPTNQFFTGQYNTNNNVIFGNNKPITSDNFYEDDYQKHQIQQHKQKDLQQKGFFGKVQNVFKNLYNQIPSIGKGNNENNSIDLLN